MLDRDSQDTFDPEKQIDPAERNMVTVAVEDSVRRMSAQGKIDELWLKKVASLVENEMYTWPGTVEGTAHSAAVDTP